MKRASTTIPTDDEILAYDNVPPAVAGKYVKMSTPTMYLGLQQGRVPFGFAIENPETNTWTYNISPGGLVKYKREGCPIIRLGDLRDIIADNVKDYIDAKLSGLNKVLNIIVDS